MIFDRIEYMRKFEREILRIQKLSENTHRVYSERLNHFFDWCQAQYFTPEEVNNTEAIKEYLARFDTPNTTSHALSALKKFFDDTLGQPLAIRYIKYPKKEKKLPDILSQREILDIVANLTNCKQKFIFLLLYSTGMRKSEIENLEEKHFDFFTDSILIKAGKGKKDRIVPMDPIIKEKFFEYKKYRDRECKKFNFAPKYFFVGQFGGKYKSVNAFLKEAATRAGITKHVHEHLIRHCYGTHMRERMIDLCAIQQLMGHESPRTTQIYAQLSNTVRKNAGTPLSDLLESQNRNKKIA